MTRLRLRVLPTFAIVGGAFLFAACSGVAPSETTPLATGGNATGQGGASFGGATLTGGVTGGATGGSTTTARGGATSVSTATDTGGVASNGGSATGGMHSMGGASNGGAPTSGGTQPVGGNSPMGGTPAVGGSLATGGAKAFGGSNATGGMQANGGTNAVGGNIATGGVATGGTKATGGNIATGGVATGGTKATGGSIATGGTATGGAATGGAATGGAATGGAATGGATGGACKFPAAHNNNGSLTWYELKQGTDLVNCSYPTNKSAETVEYTLNSGTYFAAMNTAEYATAAACGACVQVTRDNGKTVTVMIADQCPSASNPKCKSGHIDLARPAFSQLATGSEGYLGTGNGGDVGVISWKYVPCNITGNVKIHLKDTGNANWNEFLVANHRIPVAKFEAQVNGNWYLATRQTYNYFNANGGNVTFPLNIRITDLNGAVITFTIPNANSTIVDTGKQFPTCQ